MAAITGYVFSPLLVTRVPGKGCSFAHTCGATGWQAGTVVLSELNLPLNDDCEKKKYRTRRHTLCGCRWLALPFWLSHAREIALVFCRSNDSSSVSRGTVRYNQQLVIERRSIGYYAAYRRLLLRRLLHYCSVEFQRFLCLLAHAQRKDLSGASAPQLRWIQPWAKL